MKDVGDLGQARIYPVRGQLPWDWMRLAADRKGYRIQAEIERQLSRRELGPGVHRLAGCVRMSRED